MSHSRASKRFWSPFSESRNPDIENAMEFSVWPAFPAASDDDEDDDAPEARGVSTLIFFALGWEVENISIKLACLLVDVLVVFTPFDAFVATVFVTFDALDALARVTTVSSVSSPFVLSSPFTVDAGDGVGASKSSKYTIFAVSAMVCVCWRRPNGEMVVKERRATRLVAVWRPLIGRASTDATWRTPIICIKCHVGSVPRCWPSDLYLEKENGVVDVPVDESHDYVNDRKRLAVQHSVQQVQQGCTREIQAHLRQSAQADGSGREPTWRKG